MGDGVTGVLGVNRGGDGRERERFVLRDRIEQGSLGYLRYMGYLEERECT